MGTLQVLLLAGTSEAQAVASALTADEVDVVASLAGRTRAPARFPCPVRTGGFGGADGLAVWLRDHGTAALVDATHPFAPVMPSHAAIAAASVGVPRVRLVRPPWRSGEGDTWHEVGSLAEAASALARMGSRRILLTTGRLDLAPFANVAGAAFVIRSIEPPDPPFPGAVVVHDRGPYTVVGEVRLLREHRIDALVTKNSGGAATAPKLAAAGMLGVPVVMVRRPPPPPGPVVATPDDAVAWVRDQRAAVDAPAGGR